MKLIKKNTNQTDRQELLAKVIVMQLVKTCYLRSYVVKGKIYSSNKYLIKK